MKFAIGDKVAPLDEDIAGEVVQISGNEVVIESDEGFLLVYPQHELVKLEQPLSQIAPILEGAEEFLKEKELNNRKKNFSFSKKKDKKAPPMEVDLHIDKLIDSTRGLSNHEMLNLQLATAERQLKFAFQKKIQRVVFIHGVGEGVLKTELEYVLSRYDNINFYDADYQKYGLGATEVYILQNVIPE